MNNKITSNNRYLRPKIVYPIFLIFLVFFDGSLMSGFSNFLSFYDFSILPNLTFVGIFYAIHFHSDKHFAFWWWLVAVGLIFDLYYTQAIGTYLVSYLVSAYVVYLIDQRMPYQIWSTFWTIATGLLVFYFLVFIAGILVNETDIAFANYIIFTVLPTIIFNAFIEIIFYRPVESLTYIINK